MPVVPEPALQAAYDLGSFYSCLPFPCITKLACKVDCLRVKPLMPREEYYQHMAATYDLLQLSNNASCVDMIYSISFITMFPCLPLFVQHISSASSALPASHMLLALPAECYLYWYSN